LPHKIIKKADASTYNREASAFKKKMVEMGLAPQQAVKKR
jgi:hypothetical protein